MSGQGGLKKGGGVGHAVAFKDTGAQILSLPGEWWIQGDGDKEVLSVAVRMVDGYGVEGKQGKGEGIGGFRGYGDNEVFSIADCMVSG